MSDKAIRDELDKLKEHIEELHSTRTQATAPEEYQEPVSVSSNTASSPSEDDYRTTGTADSEVTLDVELQIKDFVDALDQEIKSTNPITILVVFSLGVLIGRLLPK